jgi:hypothetical protein
MKGAVLFLEFLAESTPRRLFFAVRSGEFFYYLPSLLLSL